MLQLASRRTITSMRFPTLAFALLTTSLFLQTSSVSAHAQTQTQPPVPNPSTILPLWPHGTPELAQVFGPERDRATAAERAQRGPQTVRLTDITQPTLSVFLPAAPATHARAAALVFPGGGYALLAWDLEGLDTCKWLNSLDMACLLVKYRVPETGMYPENPADLEDAQQAMRLARAHAREWRIDPGRLGVIGFSAGGHLAVALSTHWDDAHVETTSAAADVNGKLSARPDFVLLGYPAYLYFPDDHERFNPALTPVAKPNGEGTPPTFIIQAENDKSYIDSALNYYRALKDAGIPAELHLYATGGHGFGMHPAGTPEEHWPDTAATWLRGLKILP